MFLIAEAVFFFLLILAFVYFRAKGQPELARRTARYGVAACEHVSHVARERWFALVAGGDDRARGRVLAGQGNQYFHLIRDGVTIGQGLFRNHILHPDRRCMGCMFWLDWCRSRLCHPPRLRTVALYWYFFAASGW